MADKKLFAGTKIRRLRTKHNLTQTEMAGQLGVSPSYLNLIERDQRPLTVQVILKLATQFDIDLAQLQSDDRQSLVSELRGVIADPLLARDVPDLSELADVADVAPNLTRAFVKLHRAYRESVERLSGLSSQMAKDGKKAYAGATLLPADEVRQVLEQRSSYIPAIEREAEALLATLTKDLSLSGALKKWLHEHGEISVQIMPVERMINWRRRYDRHRNRLYVSERLSPADQTFEIAAEVALIACRKLIEEEVGFLKFESLEAQRLAKFEFARLIALAMMLPYNAILETARRVRYDINVLRSRFGVTFAQCAWRLTMLQAHGKNGVPFFVMETDAAGNRIRRAGANGFPMVRFGGDCPKLVVHQAFGSPGQIFAEQVITPEDARFIVIGRTIEGLRSGYLDRPQRTALLVGFDIAHASDVVYADGLVGDHAREALPIGPGCRLCERPGCIARAAAPITRPLALDEHAHGLSAFDFE